ncbi:peptidoglycan-binding protein, partial [Streptomyces sp. NPDC005065]
MVAVAGFTSGLFIPDEPRRDTALQDGRTGAPEESGRTPASLSPSASASTEPSAAKRASSSALPGAGPDTAGPPRARIGATDAGAPPALHPTR